MKRVRYYTNEVSVTEDHDWVEESEPERQLPGGLIVSIVIMKCRRCGLVSKLLHPPSGETDCDAVLVQSVLES